MDKEQHKTAAETHFSMAQDIDKKIKAETDEHKRLALITVASQNYFYAGLNIIEYIFAMSKESLHSANHEHRKNNVMLHPELFKDQLSNLYLKAEEIRGQVAYRGKNGSKYKLMKEFAAMAMGELDE